MKNIFAPAIAVFFLLSSAWGANAAVINGSINGPTSLLTGQTGTFTFNYSLGSLPTGTASVYPSAMSFHFGDGSAQGFTISQTSGLFTFDHVYLSVGDFLPSVTGTVTGFSNYTTCGTFAGVHLCQPHLQSFSATSDITGQTVAVSDVVSSSVPEPDSALLLFSGLCIAAAGRRRVKKAAA